MGRIGEAEAEPGEILDDNENVAVLLSCGHCICNACRFLLGEAKCPVCRANIISEQYTRCANKAPEDGGTIDDGPIDGGTIESSDDDEDPPPKLNRKQVQQFLNNTYRGGRSVVGYRNWKKNAHG